MAGASLVSMAVPWPGLYIRKKHKHDDQMTYDVIIIGGSYSGLAAGMALGRALRNVLIIDNGAPCNRQTPASHNFLTHDGDAPQRIAAQAKEQVDKYESVHFLKAFVDRILSDGETYVALTDEGERLVSRKLIFATGIKDILPEIPGVAECWGISVLHCPYCHGYEVKHQRTGILGNGELAFEYAALLSNWTKDLIIYTNGNPTFTPVQRVKLDQYSIAIEEKPIERLDHVNGHLKGIHFKEGTVNELNVMYTRPPFQQHCQIPEVLGCEMTEDGYIKTDVLQKTSVRGVYACGDNSTRIRTVANAVAMGTTAGMMVNKEMILESF